MIITANRPGKCIIYLNASVPTIIALSDSGRVHSGVVELRTSLELWVNIFLLNKKLLNQNNMKMCYRLNPICNGNVQHLIMNSIL